MRTKVFITIDVECGEFSPNYDGCVWGRLDNLPGKVYGLPLILDLLKKSNIKGVFFTEALSSFRHGLSNLKMITDRILAEEHEVQLHIHPSLRFPTRKPDTEIHLGKYPLDIQIDLIKRGLGVLEKCGVENVKAFRAGGFGMNKDTLTALEECGVFYDSSYNVNYLNSSCNLKLQNSQNNDVFKYGDIWEFPVTCFRNPLSSKMPFRHLQITAVSFQEMKKTLLMAHAAKMKSVVVLLHSFELINYYDKERTIGKLNQFNLNRFKKLLDFLSANSNLFEVGGFNDLSISYIDSIKQSDDSTCIVPKLPVFLKIKRQIEQLVARL